MMFLGSIFFVLLIPVIILLTIGIPLIIGICVYRDADKRVDCSPWLWALVAALAPSCIGLIIYLIIRKDYPLKENGGYSYSSYESYDQSTSGQPGQTGYGDHAPKAGLPTWAKALIIIGVVILALCILGGIGTLIYNLFAVQTSGMGYYHGF